MKLRKKISIVTLIIFVFTAYLSPLAYGISSDEIIFEEKTSEIVTSGVTHDTIKRFMLSGWLNINVLTVDLTDPYVKLDLLTSPQGIGTLDNVKTMAESAGAVGAINADFFDKFTGSGSTSGGYPIGFAYKAGSVVSSGSYENDAKNKFATFTMDKLKQVLYTYVTDSITLTTPTGNAIKAWEVNKISTDYKNPIIFNKYWGKYSIGATEKFPDMVEVVVSNGIVTEVRSSMPPVEIPQDGYVVTARQEGGKFLTDNFHVGDYAQLDIKTNPDMTMQDFAVGGGTMLVKDGSPAPITHNIAGLNPRSAVGTSKDGRYLYLAAVDGRQILSKGLTLEDFSRIMIELGAYNAINFDGGGSTTLVERTPGSTNLKVVNSPSESPLRKVVNSLGIFSTAPQGTLNGLIIDTSDTNIFVNTGRSFTVKGYDQYNNPVQINQEDVTWKNSGINGSFNGSVFTPSEVGEGTITASIQGISKSIDISALSSPVELTIYPRITTSSVNKDISYTVKGRNRNGYYAVINPSNLMWSLNNNIGQINGGVLHTTAQGNAIVSCTSGDATVFAGVSVAGETSSVVQTCENSPIAFKGYPVDVPGNAAISNEQQHSGQNSYKLSYDFTLSSESRAAYAVFLDNSIKLDANAADIGLWIYNPSPRSEWLKAMLTDSKGGTHLIDLTRDMSWTGWKFIKASIDSEISRPAQLSRVYVVQTDPAVKSSGEIYIDDITLYSKVIKELKSSDIPANIALPDPAQKDVSIKSSPTAFKFAVMGKVSPDKTLLDKIYTQKLSASLEKNAELSVLAGDISNDFYKSFKNPVITAIKGSTTTVYKNSTFITLDDSKDGLRQTDADQWKWLSAKLDKVTTDNLFIVLPKPISSGSFSDPYEMKLLQDILTDYQKKTKKNVWVISGGNSNTIMMERGVRNISSAGIVQNASDIAASLDQTKYILVTVNGKDVTYQVKNLF